jgi:hypothetical protein
MKLSWRIGGELCYGNITSVTRMHGQPYRIRVDLRAGQAIVGARNFARLDTWLAIWRSLRGFGQDHTLVESSSLSRHLVERRRGRVKAYEVIEIEKRILENTKQGM